MAAAFSNGLFMPAAPFSLTSPGPGHYDVKAPRSPGFTALKSPRIQPGSLPTIGDDSPGPQGYSPKESTIRTRPFSSWTPCERRELPTETVSRIKMLDPGPGDYVSKPVRSTQSGKILQEEAPFMWPGTDIQTPGPGTYQPEKLQRRKPAKFLKGKADRAAWLQVRQECSAPELPPALLAKMLGERQAAKKESAKRAVTANPADLHKPVDLIYPGTHKGCRIPTGARSFGLEAHFDDYIRPGPADYMPPVIMRPPKWHKSAAQCPPLDSVESLRPSVTSSGPRSQPLPARISTAPSPAPK